MPAACGEKTESPPPAASKQATVFVEFDSPHLRKGREIWINNCKACHVPGIAGAPKVTNKAAWEPRIAQGREVLYTHALNGFFGPEFTQMPARGGNNALTDEEVKAAVDYMVALVSS